MYPKVKVRNQGEEDDQLSFYDQVAFESVSLHDLDSSVWDDEDDSPPAIVRVPESYPSDLATEGEGKSVDKKKEVQFCKQIIKASHILPPRAVLSSPVNDGKVETGSRNKTKPDLNDGKIDNGSRNKTKPDLMSGLKDHNSCQTRHIRCKVVPPSREQWCHHSQPSCYHRHSSTTTTTPEATARRRVSKEASAGKPSLDDKDKSATASPSRKSKTRKERPEFICI